MYEKQNKFTISGLETHTGEELFENNSPKLPMIKLIKTTRIKDSNKVFTGKFED